MLTQNRWSELSLAKKVLIGLVALLGLSILFSVLRVVTLNTTGVQVGNYYPPRDSVSFNAVGDGMRAGSYAESDYYDSPNSIASKQIVDTEYPHESSSVGGSAEEYEALSYNASFKKRDHVTTCDTIESWKPLTHVVFERANRNDNSCYYSFKVERAQVEKVVEALKQLDPVVFNASIESMQKQVVEYDSQLTILLQKQTMLETMLADAVRAYDDLVTLATNVEDVESLTTIIDSKLRVIQNLTQQRISLSQQIDRLARNSAQLSDRIEYVSFSVSVVKYKVFDSTAIKDSWVREVQQFVSVMNGTLQQLTIGVLSMLVQMIVVIVYITIIGVVVLAFVTFGWRHIKRFWTSTEQPTEGQ